MPTNQSHPNSVPASLPVVCQTSSGMYDARLSEVSMDGCFIESMVRGRTLGEIIEFKVHLPTGPWVSLEGELVNQEYPKGFRLHFSGLSEGDRRRLSLVVAAHRGLVQGETAALSPAGESLGRVLVADDDPVTLRMVTLIVQAEGYEVVPAQDGQQAIDVLQRDADFKAAILDMKMPFLEGLDLILYMKRDERLRQIPVGMITAEQDPKVWDDSVAAGARVFLPKPFSPPQVQMMLRMLVRPTQI